MKFKNSIPLTVLMLLLNCGFCAMSYAQALIDINTVIPMGSNLSESGAKVLKQKLESSLSKSGYGGQGRDYAYILVPILDDEIYDITDGSPQMHFVDISLSLVVYNALGGRAFNSIDYNIRGVGRSKLRAYKNAMRSISVNDQRLQGFYKESASLINDYLQENCEMLITQATQSVARARSTHGKSSAATYADALMTLSSLSTSGSDCQERAITELKTILDQTSRDDCKQLLALARAEIGRADYDSAIGYLSLVPHGASCEEDISLLIAKIEKTYADNERFKQYLELKKLDYKIASEQLMYITAMQMLYYNGGERGSTQINVTSIK